ncbi:hypothetical protein, partial [Flectobacillus roseus]|uniref:hypothetical protein n=1 Tax=Flectobacillus roseus TaxID=502259 RepID=UPI0024B701FB
EINEGAYCIRVTHDDKTYSYLYSGHEIERYHKDEGEHMVEQLKSELSYSIKQNDPIYSTSINYNIGRYSELVKRKKSNEKLIKVIQYELIRYSAMLSKINETIEHDYAPVCLPYDKKTQEIIHFSNIIAIITDPLKFESFYENWIQAGFEIEECELRIIENDKDFGLYLLRFFENGQEVIIDPEFDLKKNVINGIPIVKQQD